jgi:predicted GNAT family acetyltransferase
MSASLPVPVVHNPDAHRFEAVVDGRLSRANYRLDGGTMWMVHTEVPRELEGRGIAAALVHAAFEHARAQGLKVAPVCSYVRTYMRRHPETRALLADGYPL